MAQQADQYREARMYNVVTLINVKGEGIQSPKTHHPGNLKVISGQKDHGTPQKTFCYKI